MSCEITINNGVPTVKTYPKLMQEIMVFTNIDLNQALDLYGISLTDEFNQMGIQNPTLKNLIAFNEQNIIENVQELDKQDKQDLLSLSLSNNIIDDFRSKFIDALTIDGVFGIDNNKLLESGIFSQNNLFDLESIDNINKLRNLYYKLNSYEGEISGVTDDIVLEKTLFDKVNPDEFTQTLYDNYIGLSTEEEILNKANEIGDETILENQSIIPTVIEKVKNKQTLIQYEDNGSELVIKEGNNTKTKLEQTIDVDQDFTELTQKIEFIKELPIEIYVENLPMIQEYVRSLESLAANVGIDIAGLVEGLVEKKFDDTIDFLDSLYNFLNDIQNGDGRSIMESIDEFSQTYNNYFEVENNVKQTQVEKITKPGVFMHVETNLSEEEIFEKDALLKVNDTTYQKVDDSRSIEELYSLLLDNVGLLPKGTVSVKNRALNEDIMMDELDQFISKEAKEYLTDESDINVIKKIVIYKILTNIKPTSTETVVTGIKGINIDNFIVEFNKEILNNQRLKDIFYFSNRGLEAKGVLGEYTSQVLRNELPQDSFDELVEYAKLSGNNSLSYLTQLNIGEEESNLRDYYANNLNKLSEYDNNYTVDNGYIIANTNEEFIKIKGKLYENVAPNIFGEVKTDTRYRNYDLEKPIYDNSVTKEIKGQDGGKVKIKGTNEVNDNEIEFC